jgi:quinol monooxygenase YgiN
MDKAALIITHRALPGKRDEVRRVWESHLKSNISGNRAHEAYFYCYDDKDPDVICAFQQYTDRVSLQDFVKTPWYAAYIEEMAPLIAGEPEIRAVTPVWAKSLSN